MCTSATPTRNSRNRRRTGDIGCFGSISFVKVSGDVGSGLGPRNEGSACANSARRTRSKIWQPGGTDRDQWQCMIGVVMLAAVASLACQQGESRESAGDVGVRLPLRPAPVESRDSAVRAAQVELMDGRAARATRLVMPALRAP